MDFWMKSGLESIRSIKKHHKDLYKYIVRIWLDWVKNFLKVDNCENFRYIL